MKHRAPEPPDSGTVQQQAMAALYQSAGVTVRPGGLEPRWGCAIVSHEKLGWCASACPGITAAAEVLAWRLLAAGHPVPDVEWARAVSAG